MDWLLGQLLISQQPFQCRLTLFKCFNIPAPVDTNRLVELNIFFLFFISWQDQRHATITISIFLDVLTIG